MDYAAAYLATAAGQSCHPQTWRALRQSVLALRQQVRHAAQTVAGLSGAALAQYQATTLYALQGQFRALWDALQLPDAILAGLVGGTVGGIMVVGVAVAAGAATWGLVEGIRWWRRHHRAR